MPALRGWALACVALVLAAGCAPDAEEPDPFTVGFILVGERGDLGYNQAIWDGIEAVARRFPDVSVLTKQDVPETDAAESALEAMIDEGADLLFATSFGHLDAAYAVAERHPEVVIVHQGGVEPDPDLPSFGTYFGSHAEAMFEAGIAAGAATTTGRLGFVGAFPIPATFNNINALTLGARTMRPEVTTVIELTGSWCDPHAQAAATERLLAAGADVIAQHQDCTATVLETAERAGAHSIGYHADGSEVAPRGWLTGPTWLWGPLFSSIIETVKDGTFTSSVYAGDFRGVPSRGDDPVVLTEPGPSVAPATVAAMEAAAARFTAGASAFEGPIVDREGRQVVAAGESLSVEEQDRMDWLVAGVEGDVSG